MIFYFSGTGNTRWAAMSLAESTGEKLLSIPRELEGECRYELADGERIGFCFPVHGWQPPHIVRLFIERMEVANAKGRYCFAMCTCGDDIGETVRMLNHDLARHGLQTDSAFSVAMPNTYVCLPFMDTDSKETVAKKTERAKDLIEDISQTVRDKKRGVFSLTKGTFPFLLSYVIGGYFNRWMITDKHFHADAERCINCGRCVSVCPTRNIIKDATGMPQWMHNGQCTCCMACFHHCPTHAINYGRITRKRGQYFFGNDKSHNSNI